MAQKPLTPSSASTGFFQKQPKLGNQYTDDFYFQRVLSRYLPGEIRTSTGPNGLESMLRAVGEKTVSPEVFEWVASAERDKPWVEELATFGGKKGKLHTAEGWRASGRWATEVGVPQIAYEGRYGAYSRVVMFAMYYLYSPSAALYTCPLAMTDAAAAVLKSALEKGDLTPQKRAAFQEASSRLWSRDPAKVWTSGQWMTERPGGSDVRNTETTAVVQGSETSGEGVGGGNWSISGHKWFSSATDSQMSLMLARTAKGGLSCFFAPLKTPGGEWNGVRIVRLKDKLGTRPVPTAELELTDMRGWLVGEEGRGIQTISTMLNYTRIYNAMSAISGLRRGLAIAKEFAKLRTVQNKPLWQNPLHLDTLSKLDVAWRATVQITFFTVTLLSLHENASTATYPLSSSKFPSDSPQQTSQLIRTMTPLVKLITAKVSIGGLAECMEALGGVGYLENEQELNIARMFRDANVLSIWEGTTNVLAVDTVRALKKGGGLRDLDVWVKQMIPIAAKADKTIVETLTKVWTRIHGVIEAGSVEELTAQGRNVAFSVGFVVMGLLLAIDAAADGEAIAKEVVRRFVLGGEGMQVIYGFQLIGKGGPLSIEERNISFMEKADMDCRIVFGHGLQNDKAASKL